MKKLTQNAITTLEKRYFAEGENWEALCDRVAQKVASAEETPEAATEWKPLFKQAMLNLDFLPNSPTLRNFGRNNGSGSACFVLPIGDSRKSIFKTLGDAVDVQAFGGGTGFNFSNLRPSGSNIASTGGQASGPISFMTIYDHTIGDIIKQGGTRNGANMGILRVDHPDIERFLVAKREEGLLKNFNLSVGVTDEFMLAVKNDKPFELRFKGEVHRTVPARRIWGKIVEGGWLNGEPGIVFLDTINKTNPLAPVGEIEATNPCGEQPLLPYSSCNLLSINLSNHCKGDWLNGDGDVDWEKLKTSVRTAVRFLDNVITVNTYPIPEIEEVSTATRQIGLGLMGFADLCIKLHVRYGSAESVELAKRVQWFMYEEAHATSVDLGKEKGMAPVFEQYEGFPVESRRNGALTTIAPTGTLSLIANCSGGCEPHFALEFIKECLDGEKMDMSPQVVKDWKAYHGIDAELPDFFVTSSEVSVEEHIAVQAAFQNNGIDSAVSKTINAPNGATRQDVSEAFTMAWEMGCKGITFYRDGSRDVQALYTENGQKKPGEVSKDGLARGEIKVRERATAGPSFQIQTACGKMYVDPHFSSEELIEVFIRTIGGGCEANAEALGRIISLARRGGVHEKMIARTLKQVQCRACMKSSRTEVTSCAAGIGRAIEMALEQKEAHMAAATAMEKANGSFSAINRPKGDGAAKKEKLGNTCPKCGATVYMSSGCRECVECGWSKCG